MKFVFNRECKSIQKYLYRTFCLIALISLIFILIVPSPRIIENFLNSYVQEHKLETVQGETVPKNLTLTIIFYNVQFEFYKYNSVNIVNVTVYNNQVSQIFHIIFLISLFASSYLHLSLDLTDKTNLFFEIIGTPLLIVYLINGYRFLSFFNKQGTFTYNLSQFVSKDYIMQFNYELPFFYQSPMFIFVNLVIYLTVLSKTLSILVIMNNESSSLMELFRLEAENKFSISNVQLPFLVSALIFLFLTAFTLPLIALSLAWVFTGSSTPSSEEQVDSRKKQLDRFKGILQLYGQIDVDEAAEIMKMEEIELKTFLAESVGSGALKLKFKDNKIQPAEDTELNEVLNSLELAFNTWYEQEKTRSGKKK